MMITLKSRGKKIRDIYERESTKKRYLFQTNNKTNNKTNYIKYCSRGYN